MKFNHQSKKEIKSRIVELISLVDLPKKDLIALYELIEAFKVDGEHQSDSLEEK